MQIEFQLNANWYWCRFSSSEPQREALNVEQCLMNLVIPIHDIAARPYSFCAVNLNISRAPNLHIFSLSFYGRSVSDFDLLGLIWIMLWYANLSSQHKFHLRLFFFFLWRVMMNYSDQTKTEISLWLKGIINLRSIFCVFSPRFLPYRRFFIIKSHARSHLYT